MFNEWYAKDTSKKIRAVFRNKGMSGQRLAVNAPYGYIKGEDGHLLVDEETAPVVELIFQLCVEGNGPGKIARMLKEREIPTPGTITFQRTGQTSRYFPDDPCRWNPATVLSILGQDAYLGRTTNFKTTKLVVDEETVQKIIAALENESLKYETYFKRNVVKITGEDIIVKNTKTAAGDRYVYFSPGDGKPPQGVLS